MKIALLTKYGDLAASTRQRFQQYRPYLQDVGFEINHRPLLDDDYLRNLYANIRPNRTHIVARYLDRIRWLLGRPDIDIIWLHCELLPYLPAIMERLARWPGKPIVYDFDDAIFHNYDHHHLPLVRNILGNKLKTTISGSKMTFAGNAYLADYAYSWCKQVELVPTVVNVDHYRPILNKNTCDFLSIGWIGTPSTWTEYMAPMMSILGSVASENDARLTAVGAGKAAKADPILDQYPWSEENEIPHLQEMDIGIMPLTDTPWARGKCGYKLIQYMACGLPVVASPVGVNREIVEHGVNGFLAETPNEWNQALRTLLGDAELRQKMGMAGRMKVERNYSLQVYGPKVASLLHDLAASAGRMTR